MRAVLCDACQKVGGVPVTTNPARDYLAAEALPTDWLWVAVGVERFNQRFEVCSPECASKLMADFKIPEEVAVA